MNNVPAPHDDLSFDVLKTAYNFHKVSDRRRLFANLVCRELEALDTSPKRVLDVGCGRGLGRDPAKATMYLRQIAQKTDELWGIEPDADIEPEPGIMTRVIHAPMETADVTPEFFDVAFSFLVLEHVQDPLGFFKAVHRTLKPGGVFLFLTMNSRHYFTRTAKLAHAMKIDELALRLARGKRGHDYHYPVAYRCNSPEQIDPFAQEAGFDPPAYVYEEANGAESYFRGPLRPIFWAGQFKRRVFKIQHHLLNLIGRIEKPSA